LLSAIGVLGGLCILLIWKRDWFVHPGNSRTEVTDAPPVTVVWTFEQVERGAIISTPAVTETCVYAAAIRDHALAPSGVVYCLDRHDGSVRWQFDDAGAMQHTISSPCLAGGRLYVGEGMHGNDVCKMYCLEAASGRKLWQFVTSGHIESSPCVSAGAVFFGSGDDGLYCLDAITGEKRWQFQGRWHIDTSPAVVDGCVYCGSGVSRLNQATEVFCLDAASGTLRWRTPTELPVWGSPVLRDGQAFFGLGTGRLTKTAEPPEKPAGALLCVDAATGQVCWTHRLPDAVFGRPAADAEHVYVGARDGRCYCLSRRDGQRQWDTDMGSPIVTRPALIGSCLYVAASDGRISCLNADSGRELWRFDLARHSQTQPQLLASPVVFTEETESGRHLLLYLGTELKNSVRSTAIVYCLRDDRGSAEHR
jgi:outer membrane protein assembly factor BamB